MRLTAALAGALLILASPAWAGDDPDLDRIPAGANQTQGEIPASDGVNKTLYLQDDFAFYGHRAVAVPIPGAAPSNWEERLFFDARVEWSLSQDLSVVYGGRLNLRAESDLPDREIIRHDFREGYLAWRGGEGLFIDLGRINLKSGVALGYNPTDFFKTRAVVEPLSADPSVLREDRLGTFMLFGQRVWNGFALTLAFAPKIARASAIYSDTDLPSFRPMFDRTNAHTRLLAKASVDLFDDVSPEFLIYSEAGRTRFGLNLTKIVSPSVIAYLEWSGGRRASLIDDALDFGRTTGTLPPGPPVIPENALRSFQNDLALGASYATRMNVTFNLEYHFHQAGFSDADWRNWFAAGTVLPYSPSVTGALWYIRGYASDQQEPLARSSVFLRADWQDAFMRHLDIAGFVDADTRDGSGLAQLTADWNLSRDWTIGALADVAFGPHRSDFGSLPGSMSLLLKVTRYL